MNSSSYADWLAETLPLHSRLTETVVSLVENLLKEREIDYLAVSGRTKNHQSAIDKIKRKGYTTPKNQLTDLSGIRIVVYLESDIHKVSEIIKESFTVDLDNSLDKEIQLSINQLGYRSVHFVCDLGERRADLPEHKGLANLKFEFQVRTVLQHAWAELTHDRNYKLAGKLPRELERKLFLYAGLLEIADKGLDETAKEIDQYAIETREKTEHGDLDTEITTLSLTIFITKWAEGNKISLDDPYVKFDYNILINELSQFNVHTLSSLKKIIPKNYVENLKKHHHGRLTAIGVIRDWMLITDWKRYIKDVSINWVMDEESEEILKSFFSEEEFKDFKENFHLNEEFKKLFE